MKSSQSSGYSERDGQLRVCFRLPASPMGWRGKLHFPSTAAAERRRHQPAHLQVLMRCWVFCDNGLARETQLCSEPHSDGHVRLGRSNGRSSVCVPPVERVEARFLADIVPSHAKGEATCPTHRSCEVWPHGRMSYSTDAVVQYIACSQ